MSRQILVIHLRGIGPIGEFILTVLANLWNIPGLLWHLGIAWGWYFLGPRIPNP